MASIFKGQTLLSIVLDTNIDLTTADNLKILYTKPSGATGSWIGMETNTTKVKYTIADEDQLDEVGDWTFQAFAEFAGQEGYGALVVEPVLDPILNPPAP